MPTPLEHDYIGLTEASSSLPPMEIRSSDKISSSPSPSSSSSSSSSSFSSPATHENENNNKNLKETELRLGLPGSQSPERNPSTGLLLVSLFRKDLEEKHSNNVVTNANKNVSESGVKRGFSDAIDVGSCGKWVFKVGNGSEAASVLFSSKGVKNNYNNGLKSSNSGANQLCGSTPIIKEASSNSVPEKKPLQVSDHSSAPAAKAQVVGWPPIRSFRKNSMASNSAKNDKETEEKPGISCLYVKVSMDGAPYLRKVDLKTCKNYMELSSALEKMFSCFTIGKCGSTRVPERNGLTESRLMDLLHSSEFVVTYEDKDGDWMLVGDVPWEMFTDTCRRLRIMKGSEAIGLVPGAPRAMEKCMSRN